MKLLLPFCLLLSLLLTGCETPAKRLEPQIVSQIQTGQTRAEVEKILGRPENMETGNNGRTLAVYSAQRGALGPGSSGLNVRILSLLYSPKFIVEKQLFHDNQVSYQNRFFKMDEFGKLLARDEIIQKMKPVMSRADVIAEFGPPSIESLTADGGSMLVWVAGRQRFSLLTFTYDTQSFVVICNDLGVVADYKILGKAEPKPAAK